jgi:acyl-CoA thioester hydrolase
MVTDLTCRYRAPARYDDEVTILVAVAEVASRRVVFAYRVLAPDGAVVAEGETRHLAVDGESGRPVVIPADLRATLARRPG